MVKKQPPPPKEADPQRDPLVSFRLAPHAYDLVQRAAVADERTVYDWARMQVVKAAAKALGEEAPKATDLIRRRGRKRASET